MPPTKDPMPSASNPAGQGETVYLAVGQIRRPHGVRGEMLMTVLTDFPERLKPGKHLWVGEQHDAVVLRSSRPHAQGLLVAFDDCDTPEAAGRFRNQYVFVEAASLPPLPEGEYYHHQLIGLQVVTDDGRTLGVLAEILETGANDVYVVKDDAGSELLLPVIPQVILSVDIAAGQMQVHLLPGLCSEG